MLALEAINVESRPLWKPMHMQPLFNNAKKYVDGTSEELFSKGLCVASSTTMTKEDVKICDAIKGCVKIRQTVTKRRSFFILSDILIIFASVWLSFALRFDFAIPKIYIDEVYFSFSF